MKNRALQGMVNRLTPANNTECSSADGNGSGEWVVTTIRQAMMRMRSREKSRCFIGVSDLLF